MPDEQEQAPRALWAPWRMEYIAGQREPGCVFCNALRDNRLIVHRGEKAFVIMNLFPYNNGHVMVAPVEHVPDMSSLDDAAVLEIHRLTQRSIAALRKAEHPDGFNVGTNLGRAAGAGIEDHVHQHVVPRWNGDTNFMPVLSGTKTIGEAIEETLKKIQAEF